MKLSIITPSLNRHGYLDDCIESVVSQAGDFEIEMIVQDGGSDTEVIDVLKAWKNRISSGEFSVRCNRLSFEYFVEPDSGMYQAVNRGFAKSSGDVMAWINSDDMYVPNTFQSVCKILEQYLEVSWIIGNRLIFNKDGGVAFVSPFPGAYSRTFIRNGYYRADISGFDWIPQHSAFWRRSVWEAAGPLDTGNQLVSDFRLWQNFAGHTDLVKVDSLFGGYRAHGEQLTGNPDAYPAELGVAPTLPLRYRFWSRIIRRLPFLGRVIINSPLGYLSNFLLGFSRHDLTGGNLKWDPLLETWILSPERVIPES